MDQIDPLKTLHLAAMSDQIFSDRHVLEVFLDTRISSRDEVEEALAILQQYRPALLERLREWYLSAQQPARPRSRRSRLARRNGTYVSAAGV